MPGIFCFRESILQSTAYRSPHPRKYHKILFVISK